MEDSAEAFTSFVFNNKCLSLHLKQPYARGFTHFMFFRTEALIVEMKNLSLFFFSPLTFPLFLIWYLGVWKCRVELQTQLDLILINSDVKVELHVTDHIKSKSISSIYLMESTKCQCNNTYQPFSFCYELCLYHILHCISFSAPSSFSCKPVNR